MEIKRKAYDRLKEWKDRSNGSSALMVDGARRVGKSYLVRKFVRAEYRSAILIDFSFDLNEDLISIFDGARDLDMFFAQLEAFFRVKLYRRESVIVFDEVQLYPKARQLIKHFVADGRYDYIETGSLLSIRTNTEGILIPSEEEHIALYPLDFEEFLSAMGDEVTMPYIYECFTMRKPVGNLHREIMKRYREYLIVGGMPQAVVEYCVSRDFERVDIIKKNILRLYRDDAVKYANGYKDKVIAIFDNIPGALSTKEKRFSISTLSKDARTRDYSDAFIWLQEAGIVNIAYNSSDPSVGLGLNMDNSSYKLYMADTGLLVSMAFMDKDVVSNEIHRALLLDKLSINEGMIMENAVAAALRTSGHRLFFFARNNAAMKLEVDFLIQNGKKISPIEVKSSTYTTHSSLDKFCNAYSSRIGERFIVYTKDYMEKDGIIHVPLYMASFL